MKRKTFPYGLEFLKKNPVNKRSAFFTFLIPWLLLIAVVFSSFYIWWDEVQITKATVQLRLDREAERIQTAILARMDEYEDILRAGRGFIATAPNQTITHKQWGDFVKALELDEYYKGLLGLGYIEYVNSAQLTTFESTRRADTIPNFTIKPQGTRPDYFIIKYIEPLSRNTLALGYDVGSELTRRLAAEQARDSGLPVLTGKVTLVQDNQQLPGFLLYLPVYHSSMPVSTLEQRRLALQGWVYIPFRADDFLKGILGVARPYVDFEIFDGTPVDANLRQNLLYDDDNVLHGVDTNKVPAKITSFAMSGRTWTVHYIPLVTFEQANQEGKSALILTIGLLGSFLIFLTTWQLARFGQRALHLSEANVLKLEAAKAELSHKEAERRAILSAIPDLIIRLDCGGTILEVKDSAQTVPHKSASELVGINITEAYPPEIAAKILYHQHQLFETGQPQHFEYQISVPTSDDSGRQPRDREARLVLINEHEALAIIRDITERKQAAQALEQNQAILSTFYNSAPMLMGVVEIINTQSQTDTGGYQKDIRHISDNAAAGHFFGRSPESMQDKLSSELGVAESVRTQWVDYYLQSKLNSQPVYFEYTHNTGQSISWLAATVCYVGLTDEGQERFSYIVKDITKRKQIEEALTTSQLQLQDFLDNANDLIQSVTPDGHYAYVNQAWLSTLGYTRPEVEKLTMFDVVHPDSREHCREMLKKVMAGEVVKTVEAKFIDSSGGIVIVEGSANCRFDKDGNPVITRSIFRNVTRRKRVEQELQEQRDFAFQVMNTMGQGLTVTNKENQFDYVNPAYANLLGYTSSELIGQTPYLVTFEDDHNILTEARQSRQKGEITTYETRLRHKNGQEVFVLITGVPYIRNNQIVGAIAVISNLTERKRAEQELAQAHNQAVEASRLKSEFVANMSHEIRTPLSSVISIVDLLLATPLNKQQYEFAQIAHNSAYTLLGLINDILDFSKIEANKLHLEKLIFEPLQLVETAAESLAARSHEKKLTLMTFVAPDIAPLLAGDPNRLRQVLVNLIGNAIKFTKQGSIVVKATLTNSTLHQQTVRFEVIDDGIGLTGEARKRLFQPFSQADGSTSRRYGGTGLGLSISKQLVELMGGQIGVESAGEGRGCTFWFCIPFDFPPTGDTGVQPDLCQASPGSTIELAKSWSNLKGRKILVVDDVKPHQDIICQYLTTWGISCSVAPGGEEALSMLVQATTQIQYDAVILDLSMPGMDGFALARAIEQKGIYGVNGSNIPLVLLTAFDSAKQGEQALQAGFSAYLVKPIKQFHLFETLTKILTATPRSARMANEVTEKNFVAIPAGAKNTETIKNYYADKLILLAEDNLINQKLTLLQLKKLGFRAEAVCNGEQVLVAFTTKKYDLILMDCQMPEMDGFEATQVIRLEEKRSHVTISAVEDGNNVTLYPETAVANEGNSSKKDDLTVCGIQPRIPIIAMTANAMQGDREICLAAGMDDYITKPVDTEQLRLLLAYWLGMETSIQQPVATRLQNEATARPPLAGPKIQVTNYVKVIKHAELNLEMLESLRKLVKSPEQFRQIIELYLITTAQMLVEMQAVFASGEINRLREIAHSLKSSSANLGVIKLAGLCKTLETLPVTDNREQIATLLMETVMVFEQAKTALELVQA